MTIQPDAPTARVTLLHQMGREGPGHFWLYAGHVAKIEGQPVAGDVVEVVRPAGRFYGRGFYNPESKIRVRFLTFEDIPIDEQFWHERMRQAVRLRQRIVTNSTAYRLIHGEGDRLPGLIVDRYDRFLPVTNGLPSVHIGVLFEDRRTNFWAGTWQGLYRWDGTEFRPVLGTDSPKFRVFALYEDSQGNLWGGSNSRGLFQRTPEGQVRYYGREAGLGRNYIRAITEDAEKRICVAVYERGLYRLMGEKFEKFPVEQWPGLRFPHGLHADRAGGMWIATEGAGLFYFKDGQFRQLRC